MRLPFAALGFAVAPTPYVLAHLLYDNKGELYNIFESAGFFASGGSIAQVDIPPGTAMAFTQRSKPFTPLNNHRARKVNLYRLDDYEEGDKRAYLLSFMLEYDWDFTTEVTWTIMTWNVYILAAQARFGEDHRCVKHSLKSATLFIKEKMLVLQLFLGQCQEFPPERTETFVITSDLKSGMWHRLVLDVLWQGEDTGFIQVEFDGTQVLRKESLATTLKEPRVPFLLEVGLMYTKLYPRDVIPEDADKKWVMYMNRLRITNTYEELTDESTSSGRTGLRTALTALGNMFSGRMKQD